MDKKYNIVGIIVSSIIIVYGIIFFFSISGYVTPEFNFNENIDLNIFKQTQAIATDIINVNNSIHKGLGVLISSVGFISFSYFIGNLKNK